MASHALLSGSSTHLWLILILCAILFVAFGRLVLLLPGIRPRRPVKRIRQRHAGYIIVVLGSGGHTAEMFMLLRDLDPESFPTRRYVISAGDHHSITKMHVFETQLEEIAAQKRTLYGRYDYKMVPRARQIHQSLLTSPITAIATFVACLRVFGMTPKENERNRRYPDLVIANGPATAFIVICAAFVLRYLHLPNTKDALRCVYVESWARLHRLSLTGKLLRLTGLCDRFLVQWPDLEIHNDRRAQLGEYHGPLVI